VRTGDLGRAALVGAEQDGWVLGTSCLSLRPSRQIDRDWVLCYLAHPKVRAWIKGNAKFSTIPSLSAQVLGELPFIVAPAGVQTAVSDVLGALVAKIAAHRELSRECERLHDWLLPRLVSGVLTVDM
jgi:type I restriction enzyme M protein